jgi:hypothetical protein
VPYEGELGMQRSPTSFTEELYNWLSRLGILITDPLSVIESQEEGVWYRPGGSWFLSCCYAAR